MPQHNPDARPLDSHNVGGNLSAEIHPRAEADKTQLISLVIPFHNEGKSLAVLLLDIQKEIDRLPYRFEVLLIDDVSTDDGPAVVADFAQRDSRFRLLQLPARGGQTGAFRLGFHEAQGAYIIRMDADLQDDPAYMPEFMQMIEAGYDIVIGARMDRKHHPVLQVLTKIYDGLIGLMVGTELHSNSGSFIAFRTTYLKNIPMRKNDHRYLPLIAVARGAKRLGTIPVLHHERVYGRSKYSVGKKLILGIPEVAMFLYRYFTGYYRIG